MLLLKKVEQNLGRQSLSIKLSEAAAQYLADLGYDPQYGARPMKRVLQQEVVDELAKLLISGKVAAGDTVYVSRDAAGLRFTQEQPEDFVEAKESGEIEATT